MFEYSVVVPVYNEEGSLDALFKEIKEQMDALNSPYEIVFVDDCSSDGSFSKLEGFQKKWPESTHLVKLSQRSGQTHAMRKGLDSSRGRFVITLDADLQNDPADIPRLLAKMNEGYDMVCGWRKERMDTPLKKYLSKLGNVAQRLISGLAIHDVSCTLRVFKRECVPSVALNWEGQHRFIPLSLFKNGYRIGEIVSHHRQRRFGVSKYSHRRIFRVVVDFFRMLSDRSAQ